MTELRYSPLQRFVPVLGALFFPAAGLVFCAFGVFGRPSLPAAILGLAAYAALFAWPATLRFRTRLRYGGAGIVWRSGLGPTVRIPRSRILAWEFVAPHRSDALWLVHYRAPRGRRHRTIHIPAALLRADAAHGLSFHIWLPANFHDLRAIVPRQPLRFHWFTLS